MTDKKIVNSEYVIYTNRSDYEWLMLFTYTYVYAYIVKKTEINLAELQLL